MSTATPSRAQDLGQGIFCVDTDLYRTGLAACYLIREGDRLAFVDCGTHNGVPGLLALIESMGLSADNVDYVIPTHVHLDHAGGAGTLMAACPNARLVIHPKGAAHMIDPAKLTAGATAVYGEEAFAKDFGKLEPIPEERVIVAEDGLEIDLNGRKLTAVDTPGHANHHLCLFDSLSQGFFTGDTFGISYREFDNENGEYIFAPTTPVAFDPDGWQLSLDKLMAYQPKAMYLTHYSRLDEPQRFEQRLRASIRALADIALAEEGNEAEGRAERLHQAVKDHLAEGVTAHGCKLPRDEIDRLLAVDAELNAQGLGVWLARRAKKAAANS